MKLIKVKKDSPSQDEYPCLIYNARLDAWSIGRALYGSTPKNGFWFYNDMSISRGTHWCALPKKKKEGVE